MLPLVQRHMTITGLGIGWYDGAIERTKEIKNSGRRNKMSPIIKKAVKTNDSAIWLALVRIFFGYIWLMAGIEKLEGGQFVSGMAKTLGVFASKNPYPWQQAFLNSVAIPNATLFGYAAMYGEIFVGIALLL